MFIRSGRRQVTDICLGVVDIRLIIFIYLQQLSSKINILFWKWGGKKRLVSRIYFLLKSLSNFYLSRILIKKHLLTLTYCFHNKLSDDIASFLTFQSIIMLKFLFVVFFPCNSNKTYIPRSLKNDFHQSIFATATFVTNKSLNTTVGIQFIMSYTRTNLLFDSFPIEMQTEIIVDVNPLFNY